MAERLDKELVNRRMVSTRSQAQHLIRLGSVKVDGEVISKTGAKISSESEIILLEGSHFVGRGALKLMGAKDSFNVSFKDKIIGDIGASTGGFTQVCLDEGALKVYAIDVGHDQLSSLLKNDERVVNMEGLNIRFPLELPDKLDICVVDLSFISLKLTMQTIASLLHSSGEVIALFKPQFEVGKTNIGKGGLVKSSEISEKYLKDFIDWCETDCALVCKNHCLSPISGKEGNQEYLLHLVFNR